MNLLTEKIAELKLKSNALILAHYYQCEEIQNIADYVGDSYYLSKIAKDSSNKIIIFCGVKFMAESAKILSPEKKILLPVMDAGCPMADMATYEDVVKMKNKYPEHTIVTYINSSTEVKALSDVIVTSSNAEKIISNINNDKILFVPDKNLGSYLSKKFPEKEFILWPGYCITHRKVTSESIIKCKEAISDLEVLAHPECEEEVLKLSDFIGSTGAIIDYSKKTPKNNLLIVTESGVLYPLKKTSPNKNFYVPGKTMTCLNMKKTTLQDIYNTLLTEDNEIFIDENLRLSAYNALMKMHELAK